MLFDKLKNTTLKSLKFGGTKTKGDSTEPYIVTDINTVDTPLNKLRLTKFDDGLIRGGAVGAANASIMDTLRVGKFLTDFPKGPLFIAKQVGLQLSNPALETKQIPTNRLGSGIVGKVAAGVLNTVNKLNNLVGGPTRIYNLGINTLAQVPVNAFGGHINRHGFLPYLDPSQKYESVVTENNKGNNNRLERLQNKFFNFGYANFVDTISDNFGGADSVYGIGRTKIKRTTFTGKYRDINDALFKALIVTSGSIINVGQLEPTSSFFINRKSKVDTETYTENSNIVSSSLSYSSSLSSNAQNSLIRSSNKTISGSISVKNFEPISSYGRKSKVDKENYNEPQITNVVSSSYFYKDSLRTDVPPALKGIDAIKINDDVKDYYNTGPKLHYSSVINPDSGSNTIFKKFKLTDKYTEGEDNKFKYVNPLTTSSADIQTSLTNSFNKTTTDRTKITVEPTSSVYNRKSKVAPESGYSISSTPTGSILIGNFGKPSKELEATVSKISPSDHINGTDVKHTPNDFATEEGKKITPGSNKPSVHVRNTAYNKLIEKAITVANDDSGDSDVRPKSFLAPGATRITDGVMGPDIVVVAAKSPSIDRTGGDDGRFHYFGPFKGKFGQFRTHERVDEFIMPIVFNQIDPFTGKKMDSIGFSSYISGYSETYDSNWDSIKYNGRSDFLYVFNSYKKTAQFKLQIPNFDRDKLLRNHKRLKSLQDGTAGMYYGNRLGGVITYIKLGYYLDNVPCIINSMNITIPNEASWDWDFTTNEGTNSYSHLLEANFNLTILGNEVPGLRKKSQGTEVTVEGPDLRAPQ